MLLNNTTQIIQGVQKETQPFNNISKLHVLCGLVIMVFSEISVQDESCYWTLVLMSSLICRLLNAECRNCTSNSDLQSGADFYAALEDSQLTIIENSEN